MGVGELVGGHFHNQMWATIGCLLWGTPALVRKKVSSSELSFSAQEPVISTAKPLVLPYKKILEYYLATDLLKDL